MYLSSVEIQDDYHLNYRDLLKESLRGGGPRLARILLMRSDLVNEFKCSTERMSWLNGIGERMIGPIRAILRERSLELKVFSGKNLPLFDDKGLLGAPLPATATELILHHCKGKLCQDRIGEIFSRSRFVPGFYRYRCGFDPNGQAFLEGEDSPTLQSLIGISHELGHLLFEWDYSDRDWRVQFESEAAAHVVEEVMVLAVLNVHGLTDLAKAVSNYFRQVDLLNFVLFCEEFEEIFALRKVATVFVAESLVFRESSVTAIGYQAYNAYASSVRWRKQLSVPPPGVAAHSNGCSARALRRAQRRSTSACRRASASA